MRIQKSVKLGFVVAVTLVALVPVVVCRVALRNMASHYEPETRDGVSLREYPYPFRSAIAICNDVDATTSLAEFLTIQEFLNTRNQTPLGTGIGLEIGNSFFATREDFGLISPHPTDREVIFDLMRAGYIDSIHSFDRARTREEIAGVVDVLKDAGVSITTWTNHSSAPSNLGACDECLGDDKGVEVYHSDFSVDRLGYRFVWLDAVSSIVGQGRPMSLSTFVDGFNRNHFLSSAVNNVLMEQAKFTLAAMGNSRYSMRKYNELIRVAYLDDGRPLFEFMRTNQCHYGLWDCDTAAGLAETLRETVQRRLVEQGGYMIIYTHFGANEGFPYLPQPTVRALESLARRSRAGDIWVATTSRLLQYYVNKRYLVWEARRDADGMNILIDSTQDPVRGVLVPDPDALGGLTFYVEDPDSTRIWLDGQEITNVVSNLPDETGARSVTIPVRPLEKLDTKMSMYRSRGYF